MTEAGMSSEEVRDILSSAKHYLTSLNELNEKLLQAENQINSSSTDAEQQIEAQVVSLIIELTNRLGRRKDLLIENVRNIRDNALGPILASKKDLEVKIGNTLGLIDELDKGESLDAHEIKSKSGQLGELPQVPELKEVKMVSFQIGGNVVNKIKKICSTFGSISSIAPVQIDTLEPKPGGIQVEWTVVEGQENGKDVQEFYLEKAMGDARKNHELSFFECYKGQYVQHLVRDLNPNQEYSFRVCCKFEGSTEYSPWSVIQVASTQLPPYSWKPTSGFILLKDRQIAIPQKDQPNTIFSFGAQFTVGNTIDFIFLEIGEVLKGNYFGLISLAKKKVDEKIIDLLNEETFLLSGNGEIYINGTLKSTVMPTVYTGCRVSFNCSGISQNKIRMNVDVCDKRVTYDWNTDINALHFLAHFNSSNWKIFVE